MSSETITRNDLTAILNEVLPPPDDTPPQTIYASTVAPTSADGVDGDVWFIYTPSA